MTYEMPKPTWGKDMRPYLDALLDMMRNELVSLNDALAAWRLLAVDQEAFQHEVRRLEQIAASEAATGTTEAL